MVCRFGILQVEFLPVTGEVIIFLDAFYVIDGEEGGVVLCIEEGYVVS